MDISDESLAAVFSALDTENKGYITVDQFVSTFQQFYQSTKPNSSLTSSTGPYDIKKIVSDLDPENDGIIYFDDFRKAFKGDFDEIGYMSNTKSSEIKTPALSPNFATTKSVSLSDGPENKTDDSGVHLPETSYFDGDNDSVLSAEFGPGTRIQRDETHRSWPKHRGTPYSESQQLDSPASVSRSDIIVGDVENDLELIRDQMRRMEERVEGIHTSQQIGGDSRLDRLREENARLSAQVTILEERFKEAEARAARNLEAERQHLKTIMARTSREHTNEVDSLNARISSLETECNTLRIESARIKTEHHTVVAERRRDTEALADAHEQIISLKEELGLMEKRHAREMELLRNDRNHAVQVLEELNSSIGERRRSRTSQSFGSALDGSSAMMNRLREMEEITRRLITENKMLRQQLEDAQDQLFARSLEEGRSLVRPTEKSWAAEIDNCTKEEIPYQKVVELWTKEKYANEQLRNYINRMTIRILENHPSLLEVTRGAPTV